MVSNGSYLNRGKPKRKKWKSREDNLNVVSSKWLFAVSVLLWLTLHYLTLPDVVPKICAVIAEIRKYEPEAVSWLFIFPNCHLLLLKSQRSHQEHFFLVSDLKILLCQVN